MPDERKYHQYVVVPYQLDDGQWIVEYRYHNGDVERAWFTGPKAEMRARDYAEWKNKD